MPILGKILSEYNAEVADDMFGFNKETVVGKEGLELMEKAYFQEISGLNFMGKMSGEI